MRCFRREPTLTEEQQWNAWQKHIDRIYQETVYAFKNRMIWRAIYEMFQNNQDLENCGMYVFHWLRGVYARDQAIAIRREVDRSSDVTNLTQLLYQISKRPQVISRARYKSHFSADSAIHESMQDDQFTTLCGAGPYIDVKGVKKDKKTLEKRCKKIVLYANKMIAHRTEEQPDLTLAEIHGAMDFIEDMFKKYYVILTGRSLMQAEPAVQFDWMEPFTIPWIRPRADEQ